MCGRVLAHEIAVAPVGFDVYFDNVGGEHLEAALAAMRLHGRVAVCGAVSVYNSQTAPPGPRNLFLIVVKGITIYGFRVNDFPEERDVFVKTVTRYLAEGKLTAPETIVEGIEYAPGAFIDMLRGGNIGKLLIKLA
jgi:NADPH-dependent curcumin reductase CurA